MSSSPFELIDGWLRARLEEAVMAYLDGKTRLARERGADPGFFLSFSTVGRKVGRGDLAPSKAELDAALAVHRGFQPTTWSRAQAARTLLLLALPAADAKAHLGVVDQLCEDADLGELVAIYQALPLLPFPEEYRARAAEGIRSNMNAVFEAVALRNPYPSEFLDEPAWNQLVLKCLFVGSPLYLVYGLDDRANPPLAKMLCDYAHERWAANRPVSRICRRADARRSRTSPGDRDGARARRGRALGPTQPERRRRARNARSRRRTRARRIPHVGRGRPRSSRVVG